MIEKVEYITSIFKIDVDNTYILTDIAEELAKIKLFDDYRKWLKINLNHYDAKFMKPYEKFVFLTRKYLKQRLEIENTVRIKKSKTFAKTLATKVKHVTPIVEENGLTFERIKQNGEQFFTDFEISQLDKLGGLSTCVRLQKSVSGRDGLEDKLIALMFDLLITNIIEYKPQEKTENMVNKLLGEAIKNIELH